jgi:maltooligosyltrehalose synthase
LARAQEIHANDDAGALWKETTIVLPDSAPQLWENVFTGEKLSSANEKHKSIGAGESLLHFPVALLTGVKS